MAIFAIDFGHNYPPDTGARGLDCNGDRITEDNLNVLTGLQVCKRLAEAGHKIIQTLPGDRDGDGIVDEKNLLSVNQSLIRRCQIANQSKADYFISIHFNAFNGKAHGHECFAISPKGHAIASEIVTEVCKLGFFNRGVKPGNRLYVVRSTNMPAVLVEGCFIDSERDMKLFGEISQGCVKMGDAIARGILNAIA
jgi:N-acetylmuramoyl-L-alanine amidase